MKTNRVAMLSVLALAATGQIAQAQTHPVQAQMTHPAQARMTRPAHPDLVAGQQTLAWRSLNSKGVQREALASEERKIDTLIDDLERGRAVDPHEIDRVLERANRGSF